MLPKQLAQFPCQKSRSTQEWVSFGRNSPARGEPSGKPRKPSFGDACRGHKMKDQTESTRQRDIRTKMNSDSCSQFFEKSTRQRYFFFKVTWRSIVPRSIVLSPSSASNFLGDSFTSSYWPQSLSPPARSRVIMLNGTHLAVIE